MAFMKSLLDINVNYINRQTASREYARARRRRRVVLVFVHLYPVSCSRVQAAVLVELKPGIWIVRFPVTKQGRPLRISKDRIDEAAQRACRYFSVALRAIIGQQHG